MRAEMKRSDTSLPCFSKGESNEDVVIGTLC